MSALEQLTNTSELRGKQIDAFLDAVDRSTMHSIVRSLDIGTAKEALSIYNDTLQTAQLQVSELEQSLSAQRSIISSYTSGDSLSLAQVAELQPSDLGIIASAKTSSDQISGELQSLKSATERQAISATVTFLRQSDSTYAKAAAEDLIDTTHADAVKAITSIKDVGSFRSYAEYLMSHRRPAAEEGAALAAEATEEPAKPASGNIVWRPENAETLPFSKITDYCTGLSRRDPGLAYDLKDVFTKAFDTALKVAPGVRVAERPAGPRGIAD